MALEIYLSSLSTTVLECVPHPVFDAPKTRIRSIRTCTCHGEVECPPSQDTTGRSSGHLGAHLCLVNRLDNRPCSIPYALLSSLSRRSIIGMSPENCKVQKEVLQTQTALLVYKTLFSLYVLHVLACTNTLPPHPYMKRSWYRPTDAKWIVG